MPLLHPASVQARLLSGDWTIFFVASLGVATIMFALILIPAIVWRRRPGDGLPPQFNKNPRWSIIYIGVPLLLVAALFVPSYIRTKQVDALAPSPALTVDVTAFRWSWRFAYPGTGITIVGTPRTIPTLVLPVGKTTQINLTSIDVDHSFWVPAFLFKRDALPGYENHFDLTPTKIGDFRGLCSQFCGIDHAYMLFRVRVISNTAFARWRASKGTTTI